MEIRSGGVYAASGIIWSVPAGRARNDVISSPSRRKDAQADLRRFSSLASAAVLFYNSDDTIFRKKGKAHEHTAKNRLEAALLRHEGAGAHPRRARRRRLYLQPVREILPLLPLLRHKKRGRCAHGRLRRAAACRMPALLFARPLPLGLRGHPALYGHHRSAAHALHPRHAHRRGAGHQGPHSLAGEALRVPDRRSGAALFRRQGGRDGHARVCGCLV